MITIGTQVQNTVHIMDYGDNVNVPPQTVGTVIDIRTDIFTDNPIFVVDFGEHGVCGCFPSELTTVAIIVKGEWI